MIFQAYEKKLLENDRAAFLCSVFAHIFFAQFEQMVDAWRDDLIMAGTIRLFQLKSRKQPTFTFADY